jgi:Rod binding domain-containing protein
MSFTLDMGADLPANASLSDDVQQKLRIDALKRSLGGTPTKEAKLREACQGFESVFLSKLFSEMRSTIPKDGLLHGQYEEQYYSMFDKALCDKLAESGGIGLADMMYRELKGRVLGKGGNQAGPGDVLPANRTLAAHPAAGPHPVSGQGQPPRRRAACSTRDLCRAWGSRPVTSRPRTTVKRPPPPRPPRT